MKRLTFILLLLAALAPGILAFAVPQSPAAPAAAIHLTAFGNPISRHAGLTPAPAAHRPAARRTLSCDASCYHIREKNGGQFMIGFNSDQDGYWLRNKGDLDGRDFILVGVGNTCSDGASCFEAKMVTVQNLEVVTTLCGYSAGNTFQLQSGTGHTGDVYKFVTTSGGDNYISPRVCDSAVKLSFQGAIDTPLQLGDNPGEYWRVLYFPGT